MIININELPQQPIIEQISQLEQQLFGPSAWSANAIQEELQAPHRTYLADIDPNSSNEHPIVRGYAGSWYDGYDSEIMTLAVHPNYQNQGIGNQLLTALIDDARNQGAERVLLEVRVDNDPALHLYQTHGFTQMGLRKRYYQPDGIDAYTMSLTLRTHTIGFQSNTHASTPTE